jgi:hypothetical protein
MAQTNRHVRELAEAAARRAYGYSYEGGHCSQCTIRGLMETYGEADNAIFRALGAFAGGCGGETDAGCGAYSAGAYFLGMHYGLNLEDVDGAEPPLRNRGDEVMSLVKQLHDRFIENYGSVICEGIHRRLFGRPFYVNDPEEHRKLKELTQGMKDEEGFTWCADVCGDAARWTVEILEASR